MKYVIFTAMDQTIVFVDDEGALTTKHGRARLFENIYEASSECVKISIECALARKDDGLEVTEEHMRTHFYYLEEVEDEHEFIAREDMWRR